MTENENVIPGLTRNPYNAEMTSGNFMSQTIKIKNLIPIFFLISLLILSTNSHARISIKDGVSYKKYQFNPIKTKMDMDVSFHVVKILPHKAQFKALIPLNQKQTIQELVVKNKALIGINSNFFDKEGNPLGLIISEGKLIKKLKPISWWGVFYIKENKPYIVHSNEFKFDKKINFAVEAGPRLVVNKQIQTLKPNRSAKTAIAINDKNEVFLIVTKQYIEMETLTEFLTTTREKNGLDITWALNLDGGSSTQMYLKNNDFEINIKGIKSIPIGLGIY